MTDKKLDDLVKSLHENPAYKEALKKMSDEERQLAEKASEEFLKDFQEKYLQPIWDSLGKQTKK